MMKKLLLYFLILCSYNLTAQTNNYSLEFDGIDDAVIIGEHTIHDIIDSISIMGSINYNTITTNDNIIINREGNYEIGVNGSSSELKWAIANNVPGWTWTSTGTTINPNTWYWFTFTYTNGEAKVYIDGSLIYNISANGLIGDFDGGTWNELWFGDRQGGIPNHAFNGTIDEVTIWNTVLDSLSIQQYMNCPPSGSEPGLVGYWNFEEGSGITTADQTSNGNDGTLNGGITWSTDVPAYNCCTPNPFTSQPTNQTVSVGNNAIFSLTDTLSGATYQWQMDAGTGYSDLSNAGQFSGSDTKTLTITSATMSNNNTQYRCIVTESASCMDTTDVVTLNVSESGTSINELNNSLVKLFPNPSNGIITIILSQHSNGQIILTDILGKEVLNKSFTSSEVQLNLKSLESKRTYFAKVLDSDGNVIAIKKFIDQ
tara:strand:- start:280 stop:1563 length:1284 start_codon:yes stop_codon:yes gene_type:complete